MVIRWIRILIEEYIKLMSAQYNITVNQNADFHRAFQIKENNVVVMEAMWPRSRIEAIRPCIHR